MEAKKSINRIILYSFLIIIFIIGLAGCKKEEIPQKKIPILITNISYQAQVVLGGTNIIDQTRPLQLSGEKGQKLIVLDYQSGQRNTQISIDGKVYDNIVTGQLTFEKDL